MQGQSFPGVFLTIEGIEGVGKSTAVRFIQGYLTQAKVNFIATREPGGTPMAEQIRQVLLAPNSQEVMAPATELLLMFACRAQHIATLIRPNLQAGKWVVSDRFVDASYAYQGGGRHFDLSTIEMLDNWVVDGIKPNRTILLDAPPTIGLGRTKNRGAQDRIEQEKMDFFERVRAVYLARAQQDPERFRVIDATQSLSAVQNQIKALLNELITERAL